jgi:hypothetical protein
MNHADFRRRLERAVAADLTRGRRRRRVRLAAVGFALAAVIVVLNVLPGGGSSPVQPASALERAAAALARDDDSIMHVHMLGRQYEDGRPDINWQDEFWVGPAAIRTVETSPEGRVVETGQTADAQQVWDGQRVLEAPAQGDAPSSAPDQGFRGEVLAALHKGSARVVGRGRGTLKIAAGAGRTYVVDDQTYNPIEFRTRGTGGGTVLRFVVYERLPVNAETQKLLSIAAQHRDARVVRDAEAYRAAVARLFPNG